MRRLTALLIALMLATAAAAGAGDKIKWSKSKKIEYVSPDEDPAQFDKLAEDYFNRYDVAWAPYTHNLIDRIQIVYYGWDFYCGELNFKLRNGEITPAEYEAEVRKTRKLCRKYLKFVIRIRFKNEDFYEKADEDYWRIYVPGPEAEFEPISCQTEARMDAEKKKLLVGSMSVGMLPVDDFYYERYFTIMFENPYWNEAEKSAEPPPSLKLVISGEEATRGFEWRFKHD